MSVRYHWVAKGKPADPAVPKRYYPSVLHSGRMTLRELANEVARISTLSTADTMAVIEALLAVLPNALADGKIVELGEFGSFRLRLHSQGADEPTAHVAGVIEKVLPRFTPGKVFQQTLDLIDFEKAG